MRKKTVYRQAEAVLARKSKRLAESQLRLTTPQRLAAAITDYIEWRAFALWVRLIVEVQAGVSAEMRTLLDDRCPGFLDEAAAHSRAHPQEPANLLWLSKIQNLSEWWPPAIVTEIVDELITLGLGNVRVTRRFLESGHTPR